MKLHYSVTLAMILLFTRIDASHGYTFNLTPVNQAVSVNALGTDSDVGAGSGYDYAEIEGHVFFPLPTPVSYWFRAGTSTSCGTSKTFADGRIYSDAFISFDRWQDTSAPGGPVETFHSVRGKYLFNVASDTHSTAPISIGFNFTNIEESYATVKLYDNDNHLLGTIGNGSPDRFSLFPGSTYYLELFWFEDVFNELEKYGGELSSRMECSLVEPAPVPEPSALLLLVAGLGGMGIVGRKRQVVSRAGAVTVRKIG